MAADKYVIPSHLDDPELIGLWTLDEFLAMVIPFVWGILSQHILIGMLLAGAGWWGLKKAKGGRPPGCCTWPIGIFRPASPA